MKKILTIFLMLIMVLSLVGCKGCCKESNDVDTENNGNTESNDGTENNGNTESNDGTENDGYGTNKKTYNIENIKFKNKTVEYDGKIHTLEISGQLPKGLKVEYTTNTLKNAGTIEVTAKFIEEEGYNEVPDLKASLTIVPRKIIIKPCDVTFYYGSDPIANGYEILSGVILNDDLNKLNFQVKFDSKVNKQTPIGKYDNVVDITYTENSNYIVTVEKSSCTILEYIPISYNINYILYDSINAIDNPLIATEYDEIILKEPTKVGYTFDGWYLDSNFKYKVDKISKGGTKDINLYAKFIPNAYKITYIVNNESVYEEDVNYGDTVTLKYGIVLGDNQVIKWIINGTEHDPNTEVLYNYDSNIIATALTAYSGTDFAFTFSIDTATITGYYGNSNSVVIPKYIQKNNQHYLVTAIGAEAFSNHFSITDVTIPDSVTTIGIEAFYKCTNLTNITIPDSVTAIGADALYKCTNLESATLGKNLKTIGSSAFQECEKLSSIVIPDSVTTIGNYAFDKCYSLKNVTIGENVENIGDYVFRDCKSMTFVVIPKTVSIMGEYVFCEYGSLFVYCEISNKPSTWSSSWKSDALPVYWGVDKDYIYKEDKIEYVLDDNTKEAKVTRYLSNNGDIVVPSAIIFNDKIYNVTRICQYAFKYNDEISSIELSDSIKYIDDYSFYGCSNLTTVTLPSTIVNVGSSAFENCKNLKYVYYNGTIEKWCNISFSNYYSNPMSNGEFFYMLDSNNEHYEVKEIEIPNSITIIGNYQFADFDNVISIKIPNGVTSIGKSSFSWCISLTNIIIPDTVESIYSNAFYNCMRLNMIIIPKSVKEIENYAFEECSKLNIYCEVSSQPRNWHSNWNYSNRPVYWGVAKDSFVVVDKIQYMLISSTSVMIIGYVGNDDNLLIPSAISVNDKIYNVKSIQSYAFYDNNDLVNVVIPDSVTNIGFGAFRNCSNLTSITIPFVGNIMDSQSNNHFGYIFGASEADDNDIFVPSSLKQVVITNGTYISEKAIFNCPSITDITLPNSITKIDEHAFASCYELKSINMPDSLTSIGSAAFYNCRKLESVEFGLNLTKIGDWAFEYCSNLTSVEFGLNLTTIGDSAFSKCTSLTNVIIPRNVYTIGDWAFSKCENLLTVYVPKRTTFIGYQAFRDCGKLSIHCERSSEPSTWDSYWNESNRPVYWNSYSIYYTDDNGLKYELNLDTNTVNVSEYVGTSNMVTIDGTVEMLGINYDVTSIKSRAFSGCSSLTSIIIPESIETIGDSAFYYCKNLKSIKIPNSVTSIGEYTFSDCTSLTSITIPESVTSIGMSAFSDCTSLISIEIPNSVTSIGMSAFSGCSNLTSIILPDSVTSIGLDAFEGCSNLTSITVSSNNKVYDSRDNCNAIIETSTNTLIVGCQNTVIPDSVTSIGYDAFSGCSNLTSIIIPDSVTSIKWNAFSGCSKLTIYCEAQSKPSGWDRDWNPDNRPVVWNYKN